MLAIKSTSNRLLIARPLLVAGTSTGRPFVNRLAARYNHTAQQQQQKQQQPHQQHHHDFKTLSEEEPHLRKGDLYVNDEENYISEAWQHPDVKMTELKSVGVAHHDPKNWTDRVAKRALVMVRSTFDWFTGYTHPPPGKENDPAYKLPPEKWMQRFVFLESVAGVPGMVGGMVRHLNSIRLLRRDRAWIETLLEEAYNERMHLLTFIKMTQPGWFMKLTILAAQGTFFNTFFIAYLINPRICHRFVGYLEEEAVVTYTRCIEDIEKGWYPEWEKTLAPDIALQYWNMPKGSTIKDLLYYVRADECKHREVNHTFGNLNQISDRNPYAMVKVNGSPQPRKDMKNHNVRPVGWDRDDIAA